MDNRWAKQRVRRGGGGARGGSLIVVAARVRGGPGRFPLAGIRPKSLGVHGVEVVGQGVLRVIDGEPRRPAQRLLAERQVPPGVQSVLKLLQPEALHRRGHPPPRPPGGR